MLAEQGENFDLISLCPLLTEILFYLTYRDIKDVRLVSRRMYDIIKTNGVHLDRPTVSLQLMFNQQLEREYITMFYYKKENDILNSLCKKQLCGFHITETRLRLTDYPYAFEDYLVENGGILLADGEEFEDKDLIAEIEERNSYRYYQDFDISNIEEGLEMMLAALFRRFYVKTLSIWNGSILAGSREYRWIDILMNEFKKAGSKCESLFLTSEYYEMRRLYETLGSSVSVRLQSVSIEEFLPLHRFDRPFYISLVEEQPTKLLLSCAHLVKKWTAGAISMKDLAFFARPFSFSKDQLLFSLRGLPLVSIKHKGLQEWPPLEILIERRSGDMHLLIEYHKHALSFTEKDITP